jgi:type IV pilus assembly protein PilY1
MNNKRIEIYAGLCCGLLFASLANAAGLSISSIPLYVTQPLAPNIVISPVYNTEYNEVSLRNAPWDYINAACNADLEQPCNRPTNLWQIGAPFYQNHTPAFGWRVTPWPNVVQVDASHVTSDVTLYPHDNVVWNGVNQFKPLDYIAGVATQFVTADQYPGTAALNNLVAAGKVRYSRSDLNFLYFNKTVADSVGYSPWPALGNWTFPSYQNDTEASTPYYHPINRHDLKANLSAVGSNYSIYCSPTLTVKECLSNQMSLVDSYIGQYWTYNGTGNVWNNASYTQTKWSDAGMSQSDKINFGHWFTYWRSSDLAVRGMMGRLVDALGKNKKDLLGRLRLGVFHADMNGNRSVHVEAGDSEDAVVQSLADIIYSQNSVFTTVLYDYDFGFTRRGTYSVWNPYDTVDYFKTADPYREDPRYATSAANPLRSCRRNYEIVLTPDYSGLRRDDPRLAIPRSTAVYSGNYDAALGAPYSDNYSNTLGDVGAYGWNTDLMPGLEDNLLPSKLDEKTSQHLVRYVIGPSDKGIVFNTTINSYDAALTHLISHPASGWVDPSTTSLLGPAVIDELWHMALNSRGFFYGGDNIGDALDKLLQSLNDILVNNVSGSSVATSTTSLSTGGLIYQATVESDWKGHLRSYNISPTVNANSKAILAVDYGTPIWDLAERISAQNWSARKIATYNGTAGVPFLWENIGTNAKSLLKTGPPTGIADADAYGAKLLQYLRGSGECEDGAGTTCSSDVTYTFRRRNLERNNTAAYSASNPGGRNVLGDIANSNPWLVSSPVAGLSDVDFPGYNAYRVARKSRPNVLYVGANDGMLHAVNASDGTEMFAYVPSFVQTDLNELSRTSYGHKYFVDGSPFSANVDVDGWRTLLAGGANRGGKGYYLLDVTDPADNTQANAASWVKWEFTHNDLYYTYNLPVADGNGQARQIVRMNDGKWALIVGNGYPEEAAKQACLFIIYLSGPTGTNSTWTENTDYRKLCVGATDYTATGGLGTNGLSTPSPFDTNGDGKADVVYAGDLNGNMWRFNVADASPANWTVAYSGAPLFVAKNAANLRQPIISPPAVTLYKSGATVGQLVLFGTGKYIELDDRANVDVQSFYGVWDRGLSGITRSNLIAQVLDSAESVGNVVVRKQTTKSIPTYCSTEADATACTNGQKYLGWYWDMPTSGERLTGKVSLINSVVLFNTFYPATEAYDCSTVDGVTTCKTRLDPCKYGGDGWLMGLNAVNGYMEDRFPVFDVNQDGVVDSSDTKVAGVRVGATMGGTSFARGIGDTMIGLYSPSNKAQSDKNNKAVIYTPTATGRVSWFELLD